MYNEEYNAVESESMDDRISKCEEKIKKLFDHLDLPMEDETGEAAQEETSEEIPIGRKKTQGLLIAKIGGELPEKK